MATKLTSRQRAVLSFLVECIRERRRPPTIREIQARFGWRSPNSVAAHLAALEAKRLICREPNVHRNIQLLDNCTNWSDLYSAVE